MKLLAITLDANSSACVMVDGVPIAAISEERFNKVKNYVGYPKAAVEYCLEAAGGAVDKVLLPSPELDPVLVLTHWTRRNVQQRMDEQNKYWYPKLYKNQNLNYLDVFPETADYNQYPGEDFWRQIDFTAPKDERARVFRDLRKQMVAEHIGIDPAKIEFKDHHLCHSNYAYFASPIRDEPVLSFTADGFGDYWNATLRLFDENGKSTVLMETTDALLGRLYRFTTLNLKMKPLEDEYKVMGLAPYATEYHWRKPYEVFKELLKVDGINFRVLEQPQDFFFHYKKRLESCRFDAIAGGLQKFLEETVVEWVRNAIKETGVRTVVFSGGVSMNVKAMMEVAKIPELKALYVPPSGADESLCIGAAYHEESLVRPHNEIRHVTNSYLGKGYSQDEIDAFVSDNKLGDRYEVVDNVDPHEIALMLEAGAVVGVFYGNMEFGARALGARSILADPRKRDTVKRINYKIKNRDFWMPFAPVVLAERFEDYFENEKDLISPFMTIGFNTTDRGRKDLIAALHAADLTGRPQRITAEHNPKYYNVVKAFEKLTGVGALLNTSYNLHGLPIAMTPEDAMHVFENSGLDALVLENTMLKKVTG